MTERLLGNRIVLGPGGHKKPLTEEEHWQLVEEHYHKLQSADEDSVEAALAASWEAIAEVRGGQMERGQDCRASKFPLSSLFYYVEMGFYPPPELLLALHSCWRVYEDACGEITLEEAFLGRPVQKAGNYARRRLSTMKWLRITWEFSDQLRSGKSRTEAAEAASSAVGGKPDADSILRMLRGWKGVASKPPPCSSEK